MDSVIKRFLEYVKIDTQSDEKSKTFPSTKIQLNLANKLIEELKALNLKNVKLDENGYVTAELESNIDQQVPIIGFIAHMDTSPDMSGYDVHPRIIDNYQGDDIVLNREKQVILSTKEFPELNDYIGDTLIVTDGTTLLGADDKAGIAEIMSAVEYLKNNPEIKHGTVKIAFTPDEEIGRGVDKFNLKEFNADYAYTIDSGKIGLLEYENFNAANVEVIINGKNIHPGYAKNKMKNAINIGNEFHSLLPPDQRPENTEGYEGYFHLNSISGNVERLEMGYIVRDHDMELFEKRKELMKQCCDFINNKYSKDTIEMEIRDVYYNMKEKIEPVMFIVDIAKKAMEELGIIPLICPIRGGTDGARLSYMGLPCPNIFTGGHNAHGKYEFASVNTMKKAVQVILKIIELFQDL